MVAGEYLKFFVFTGMSLDQALRSELSPRTCVRVVVTQAGCYQTMPSAAPHPQRGPQEQADPGGPTGNPNYLLHGGGWVPKWSPSRPSAKEHPWS